MRLLIVTWDYPDERRSVFPFVKNLVAEWVKQGHDCTVIAPFSVTRNKRFCKQFSSELVGSGYIKVIRPNYITISNVRVHGLSLSSISHKRAVNKGLRSVKEMPDAVYCHFWNTAVEVIPYVAKHSLPLFVATGESTLDPSLYDNAKVLRKFVTGVVAVSTQNREMSIKMGLTTPDICNVFPNAIDNSLFYKQDKEKCRKELSFPLKVFIVVFVGWFNERKGSKRVEAALKQITGEPVYSVFVGSGEDEPVVDNMLFKGQVPHHQVPKYLNAADAFVLPTLNEGCCNAVVEAMACGLPIISSNRQFNYDVCDESNSILIDPNSVEAIRDAVILIRDNKELREKLSTGSIQKALSLTIDKRARSIISFVKNRMGSNNPL